MLKAGVKHHLLWTFSWLIELPIILKPETSGWHAVTVTDTSKPNLISWRCYWWQQTTSERDRPKTAFWLWQFFKTSSSFLLGWWSCRAEKEQFRYEELGCSQRVNKKKIGVIRLQLPGSLEFRIVSTWHDGTGTAALAVHRAKSRGSILHQGGPEESPWEMLIEQIALRLCWRVVLLSWCTCSWLVYLTVLNRHDLLPMDLKEIQFSKWGCLRWFLPGVVRLLFTGCLFYVFLFSDMA